MSRPTLFFRLVSGAIGGAGLYLWIDMHDPIGGICALAVSLVWWICGEKERESP